MIKKIRILPWLSAFGAVASLFISPTGVRAAPYDGDRPVPPQRGSISGRVQSIDKESDLFVLNTGKSRVTILIRDADLLRGNERRESDREPFRADMIRRGQSVVAEGVWVDSGILRASVIRFADPNVGSLLGASDDPSRPSRDALDKPDRFPPIPPFKEGRSRDGLSGIILNAPSDGDRNLRVTVFGREIKVGVPRNVRVSRDSDPISVHELKRGDRVRVIGDWMSRDAIQAIRIQAISYEEGRVPARDGFIVGSILRIDLRRHQLSLRTPDGIFDVDATDADVMRADRIQPFADMLEGDRIRVHVEIRRGRLIVADRIDTGDFPRITDRPSVTDELRPNSASEDQTGAIRSIDYLNRTFELRLNLKTVTVRVTSDTDIFDKNGDAIKFSELKEGQEVSVSGDQNDAAGILKAVRVKIADE